MTVRLYVAAALIAALLTTMALALVARGYFGLGIVFGLIALLIEIPALIFLLRKAQR